MAHEESTIGSLRNKFDIKVTAQRLHLHPPFASHVMTLHSHMFATSHILIVEDPVGGSRVGGVLEIGRGKGVPCEGLEWKGEWVDTHTTSAMDGRALI